MQKTWLWLGIKRIEMANDCVKSYLSKGMKGTWSSLFIISTMPSFKEEAEKQPSQALLVGMKIRPVLTFWLLVGNLYQNPK